MGIDALSNEKLTDAELSRFKVIRSAHPPLSATLWTSNLPQPTSPNYPEEVRKKLRALERAFAQDASLFEEEEMMQRREQEIGPQSPLGPFVEYRAATKRAQEEANEQAAREETARREKEREEVRRKLQERMTQNDSDQWWLQYKPGGGKARELAKWRARLKRFQKIANASVAEGEQENAKRLAKQASCGRPARAKIESLENANELGEENEPNEEAAEEAGEEADDE
ncbi:MAG: hypothetical protein SGPRY_009649 [Prymnesium sp.]